MADYAARLGIKEPSLSRKLKDEAFTLGDILELAALTETSLCLLDKDKNIVTTFND